MLLPGSRFRIDSVQPISAPGGANAKGSPITEWFYVKCSNTANPGTAADTEQPPAPAKPPVPAHDPVMERLGPQGGSAPADDWLRGGGLYDDDSAFASRL